jgi:predicted TIM-barrel fold metal-dependent hydrolase
LLQDKHPRDTVNLIKEIGADRCILTTDSFFDWVPPEPEIMRMAIATYLELGISEEEMRMMVQRNPAVLLGLEG